MTSYMSCRSKPVTRVSNATGRACVAPDFVWYNFGFPIRELKVLPGNVAAKAALPVKIVFMKAMFSSGSQRPPIQRAGPREAW